MNVLTEFEVEKFTMKEQIVPVNILIYGIALMLVLPLKSLRRSINKTGYIFLEENLLKIFIEKQKKTSHTTKLLFNLHLHAYIHVLSLEVC